MVVSNTLLRKQSTSQKGQSLPFPLVASLPNGCFYMVQQPWFLVSWTYLPMLCTITYLTRWKERGTIKFIPELVHNLAPALALRAPIMMILLAELGWLPLKERRDNHKNCISFKLSRGFTPLSLTVVLPIQRYTCYNLRRRGYGSMSIIRCRFLQNMIVECH